MKNVSNLKIRQKSTIIELRLKGLTAKRLAEMGFIPYAEIRLIKKAPLGDPLLVEILGYRVAIRKKTAERIIVI